MTDATPAAELITDMITVRGARENNLKRLDVNLPRGRLVVVTGASGGGKSSLLMGTVFAEGRRRFLATLPPAARAAAGALRRPAVDSVSGLPPVVAVSQSMGRAGKRATVATLAELSDNLNLLFARAGLAHCPTCGAALQAQTIDAIAQRLLSLPQRTKLIVLAPLLDGLGDTAEVLARVVAEGFVRVRVDGQTLEAAEVDPRDDSQPHTIEAVVDRLVVKDGIEERLRESLDLAVEQAGGRCVVTEIVPGGDRAGLDVPHSVRFACGACGVSYPDPEPRLFSFQSPYGACDACRGYGLIEHDDGSETVCETCEGQRLQPFARGVTLGDINLPEVWAKRPGEVIAWAESLASDDPIEAAAIQLVVPEIIRRCETLDQLGLGYLSLNRRGRSLSGGEAQRVRLVASLGSGLSSVAYLLDEPTAGLHPADTARLLDSLHALRDAGNTVAVIEHDEAVIDAADWLVEIGPGGGREGGRLVYEGPADAAPSLDAGPTIEASPATGERPRLTVTGAVARTLQNIDVSIPVGAVTGLSGVSGSGKSTLMHEVLRPCVAAVIDRKPPPPGLCKAINVPEEIAAVAVVDQHAAGRSTRSTPATLLGLWGLVRQVFERTRIARLRGYTASRFSFNSSDGACETCHGRGQLRLRSTLLSEEAVTCPACHGARFNEATLEVAFKGLTLADVLRLTIAEAADLFENLSKLAEPLRRCEQVGLGYLTLGQPAQTLSGGERQRLKLLRTLGGRRVVPTLYLLDEPTGGLHRGEVEQLIRLLRLMTDQGHTFVVIEHHLRLLAACDHLIDLGPGAGPDGGRVVAAGTPREVAASKTATGVALRNILGTG